MFTGELVRTHGTDLQRALERRIAQRTWGRVRHLKVEVGPDGVVVRGLTSSYYVKQLAIQAVVDVCGGLPSVPITLDIEVGSDVVAP